ncbi:MAG: oligosaccharide flippase family protein [Bacteroidales bacterium]|jgi:PST family polysaccharide transporter
MSQFRSGIVGKIRRHGGIIQNFSYLSVIQLVNLLVTLATYPFLIRVLGKEVFGLVVYAQAIITYLVVLISFGFQISATREVSIHRNDPRKLNEIFSSVLILKGLLFLASVGLLFLITLFIPQAREHKVLFLLSMFTCFYEFIFPFWFFQGIEKMGYLTLITLITKLTFFILIFLFIRSKKDYLLVPLFNGIGSVLAGVISIWIAVVREKVRFSFQPFHRLWHYFRESSALFVSNFANQVYVNANKVIVGLSLGMGEVALYDLAEKIVLAMKIPQNMLNQAIFPKIIKERNVAFSKKILLYSMVGQAAFFFLIVLTSSVLVLLLGGREMSQSTGLLRLLALTVPVNAISSFLGIQFLVAHGFKRLYTRVIVLSVVLYALMCTGLWVNGSISLISVILATIATEVFGLVAMMVMVGRRRLG